jgi:hypothetical protein
MVAIDTLYKGNYFRSRLEARWAYFFDSVGMGYEYEVEGFKNSNGECYLPDFFLPKCYMRSLRPGVYVEIKPESYPDDDIPAASWFTRPLFLFKGTPDKLIWGEYCDNGFQLGRGWDNYMGLWKCSVCGGFKIDYNEGGYDNCPHCKRGQNNYEFLRSAAKQALLKRFEHNG